MKTTRLISALCVCFMPFFAFSQDTAILAKKYFKGQLITPYEIHTQIDTSYYQEAFTNRSNCHFFLRYENGISLDSAFAQGLFITSDTYFQFFETQQIRSQLPSNLESYYYTNISNPYLQRQFDYSYENNEGSYSEKYYETMLYGSLWIDSRLKFSKYKEMSPSGDVVNAKFLIRNFEMFYIPVGYVTFKTINYNAKNKDDAFITRRVMCYFITDIVNMD